MSEKNDDTEPEVSFLDISGIGLSDDDEEENETNESSTSIIRPTSSVSGISAVPSGSGMTFLMDSSFEEEDDDDEEGEEPQSLIGKELLKMNKKLGNVEEEEEGEELLGPSENGDENSQRKKEVTDKFLAGQLSFTDYVKEFNEESDEEDEEDKELKDEDWMLEPSPVKKKKKVELGSDSESGDEESSNKESLFEAELNETQRQQLGKKRKKVGVSKRRKRLDPALQGLMGEANLRFARGDNETAIRMCMEVIRQDPSAPEPFQTLSTLYEESGDQEKCLQFALIAAHLAPQDPEEWARLADMSLELEDPGQAAMCFRKAIDADIENLRYHLARCNLLEQVGDERAALRGYRRLLFVLKDDQGEEYLQTSKEIARLLHQRNDVEGAKNAMRNAVQKHPKYVTEEDINLVLELMISLSQNEDALEILCQYSSVKFSSSQSRDKVDLLDPEIQLKTFNKVLVPEEMPLEIVSKLATVLVNLGALHLTSDICNSILEADPDEYGDIMLDLSEALMNNGHHRESIPILEKLIQSDEYSKAAVWLKYGESLYETKDLEAAANAFQTVVDLAPKHLDARRTLSNILHKLGRAEEAIHLLTQDEAAELLNPTLLYEKCQLLLSENQTEEFISKAKLLFSRHFIQIRSRDEVVTLISNKKLSLKNRALSEVRSFAGRSENSSNDEGPSFEEQTKISVQDEFELFKKLCSVLMDEKRFPEFQRLTFSSMGSPVFNKNVDIMKECEFLCLISSFLNEDSFSAYNIVRELVPKNVNNNSLWNLFNIVIMRSDDQRHNRFLMRLMSKNSDVLALGILNGHNCLVAGTYKYTLGEYMSAFKLDPENPLLALLLGLTFVHLACQKFSAKKHSLVVQACAFLNQYLQLRGKCQESYYNLGRAMHQLGLLPAAIHYYKRCLSLKASCCCSSSSDQNWTRFNLEKEAAYNLCLIYRNSGSHDLARLYTQKHIVI